MKKKVWLLILLLAAVIVRGSAQAEYLGGGPEDFQREYGSVCRLDGDTLTLFEGVCAVGCYEGEVVGGDEQFGAPDPEMEKLFLDAPFFWGEDFSLSKVIWPTTIRALGVEAFVSLSFSAFTVPSTLERIYPYAFTYCSFDELTIACHLPWDQIADWLFDCTVGAYAVPEDHPLYRTVDGVLYTKDGKVLLAYPNGRRAAHFDVPAGVEAIGERAFSGNAWLKTVSLPIGLKTVEDYAFAECTRLQAMAVPLTVTAISPTAFYSCVSLERVSLPPGLTAYKRGDAEFYGDDSLFRGDNGDTLGGSHTQAEGRYSQYAYYGFAYLPEGEDVPIYESEQGAKKASAAPGGTPVYAGKMANGRCSVQAVPSGETLGWVETTKLRFFQNETLFDYAYESLLPLAEASRNGMDPETMDLTEPRGPWLYFYSSVGYVPLADAWLYRKQDAKTAGGTMGIAVDSEPLALIPLLDEPNGGEIERLHVGTQVKVLEERGDWLHVTTGFNAGWLPKEHFRLVPMMNEQEGE